jgi:hypothetical protein
MEGFPFHCFVLKSTLIVLLHVLLNHSSGSHTEKHKHREVRVGLSGIESLGALTWLSIADCDLINDSDRFALASLLQLRSLDLGGTKISLTTLEFLLPLTKLTNVCLDGCVKVLLILCMPSPSSHSKQQKFA